MKMQLKLFISIFCFLVLPPEHVRADSSWQFKLIAETPQLSHYPFYLMTVADLNRNGYKELVIADFGKFGAHQSRDQELYRSVPYDLFQLFVLEWNRDTLKERWRKQWDIGKTARAAWEKGIRFTDKETAEYFLGWKAKQLVSWTVGERTVVETIPPYFGLEWTKGAYILHEQHRPSEGDPSIVGSWALPWIHPFCYSGFVSRSGYSSGAKYNGKYDPPRECLLGIRRFSNKEPPKIISLSIEEITRDKHYKNILHIRSNRPGFPIEWSSDLNEDKGWRIRVPRRIPIDRFNSKLNKYFLIANYYDDSLKLLSYDKHRRTYQLKHIKQSVDDFVNKLDTGDLPDAYIRNTQGKEIEEYWSYGNIKAKIQGEMVQLPILRRTVPKPDYSSFVSQDIVIPHHKDFVGVGYFAVEDIDSDGIDEVIFVEQTGKPIFHAEWVEYKDVKDYIRILKWDGKKYKTMWVSPPYNRRGTKFLIEDIKKSGKKQMVVMGGHGRVQIWDRK